MSTGFTLGYLDHFILIDTNKRFRNRQITQDKQCQQLEQPTPSISETCCFLKKQTHCFSRGSSRCLPPNPDSGNWPHFLEWLCPTLVSQSPFDGEFSVLSQSGSEKEVSVEIVQLWRRWARTGHVTKGRWQKNQEMQVSCMSKSKGKPLSNPLH